MKKNRKFSIRLFSSRNKWARRGRNLAHFIMSFLFCVFAYVLNTIFIIIKWIFSVIFLGIKRLFSTNKKDKQNTVSSADKEYKKTDVKISIALPDRFTRLKVLIAQLKNKSIEDNLNIGSIINLTEGCSETDILEIVNRAEQKASLRNPSGFEGNEIVSICEQDFLLALAELKPNVSQEALKRCEEIEN